MISHEQLKKLQLALSPQSEELRHLSREEVCDLLQEMGRSREAVAENRARTVDEICRLKAQERSDAAEAERARKALQELAAAHGSSVLEDVVAVGTLPPSPRRKSVAAGLPEHLLVKIAALAQRERALEKFPPLIRALLELRAAETHRVKRDLRSQLKGELLNLMKQHRAIYGLLFFKVSDHVLRTEATHNTDLPKYSMPIAGHGVVPHVARELLSVRLPNERWPKVQDCLFYKDDIEETKSLLAVPIRTPDGRLLGVLDLESPEIGQFPAGSEQRLQEQVRCLVPTLLCLEALLMSAGLFAWPWCPHFGRGGWSLNEALEAAGEALARAVHADKARVTIWNADWEKRCLFALGTSLPHEEYLTKPLPEVSRTYQVAATEKGAWVYVNPAEPGFYDRDEAIHLGLTDLYVAKVRRPEAVRPNAPPRPLGTCNLYLYTNKGSQVIDVSGREFAQAADLIGAMWASHQSLRKEVARAYFDNLLDNPPKGRTSYQVVRDVLAECLDATGCTVLLHLAAEHKLLCVATTGLVLSDQDEHMVVHTPGNRHSEVYDLDEVAIATFLARQPGTLVRKNNLMDEGEPGVPEGLPPADFSKQLDDDIPTKERRFLAMSVAPAGKTLAVVRLVRPMDRPPFTPDDAELFRFLMEDVWGPRLAVKMALEEEDDTVNSDIGGEAG